VFQSDKYKQFTKQYMDIDGQKKEALLRVVTLRQKASERALSSRNGRSKPALSRVSKSIIDGDKSDKDRSQSSFQKEGGEESMGEASIHREGMDDQPEEDHTLRNDDPMDDKLTIPDETKTNLMKQQEMIVLYDPLSRFIIKNAAYFLILFMFVEIMLLPLSIMNFILLVLMTIIVIKMLFCDTRLETYRSLTNVLHVLNIFAILYIFTKYMFLLTQYT
jgi:hypothetical protein